MPSILMVTGASRGIGAAVARAAGAAGYDVCVNYHSNEALARAVVADIEKAGQRAIAVQADTGSEAEIERLFEKCDRELGTVTGLVNNAGVVGGQCLIEDVTGDILERCFAVNISGYFLCAREAIHRMSTRRGGAGGAIVNISSVAARLANPFLWVHYGASKGAVDTLTTGLAMECADLGIRVNGVRPGIIDTDIHPEGRLEEIAPSLPLKRAGSPEEVAAAVLYLLSDEASYSTGASLDVSGGR